MRWVDAVHVNQITQARHVIAISLRYESGHLLDASGLTLTPHLLEKSKDSPRLYFSLLTGSICECLETFCVLSEIYILCALQLLYLMGIWEEGQDEILFHSNSFGE